MITRIAILGLVTLTTLTACGQQREGGIFNNRRVAFDGQYFRANLDRNRDDYAALQITVRPVSRSLLGAREAGRYEATRHCIKYFGNSRVDWDVGPDAPADQLLIAEDTLTLIGRCEGER